MIEATTNQKSSEHNLSSNHSKLTSIIWSVADNLRGTYRPPQYRKVMLPLIVLARFDAVLSQYTDEMKAMYDIELSKPEDQRMNEVFLGKAISKKIGVERQQPLYNISGFNLERIKADAENIASNLNKYIQGFSPKAKDIFDKFEFENEIIKLDENNILYKVIDDFLGNIKKAGLDLSPDSISNLQMGYVFEDLVRRFNEQANEEAGDHFTPREVIDLMVNVIFEEDQAELVKSGVYRSIYDPTAGTGGMLSVAEKHLKGYNNSISLALFGQEYNAESYAICCADLLIKDEPADNIVYGNTLGVKNAKNTNGGYSACDGHQGKTFDYMFANPPYGVSWKNEESFIKDEEKLKFDGRFGAGLPRINDGSLLFLQHMISKMKSVTNNTSNGGGSRIAVVFNGSPMFTGDAGSGESNIRRWMIENDWLEAIIALPDQMFYNTGIYTYIWIVSNKKSAKRAGKVQLIDATEHYQKMRKSLGNKRNEFSKEHIEEITQLYANFKHNDTSKTITDKQGKPKVCSKIFNNQDFATIKLTVERPLRLNFCITAERIAKLDEQTAFINVAKSKKIKDKDQIAKDITQGQAQQQQIKDLLTDAISDEVYQNNQAFERVITTLLKQLDFKISAPLKKSIINALSEKDATAEPCTDKKGTILTDSDLRDTESVPLPNNIALPLPIAFNSEKGDDTGLDEFLALVKEHCQRYMQDEVLPHVPDAWVDYSKTKIGYEIPLNRHFYQYQAPRELAEIKAEITALEQEIIAMLGGV
ncbi:MAG: SAM-dependent DNA methyltransferase [Gammaproteobacteria bacterium]|nr:SAM-dependent DNA methyltransferase [Gammaproteobacteria bacterium]